MELVKKKSAAFDRHYTVAQLAEAWGLSEQMVRNVFEREEGCIRIGSPVLKAGRKRKYTTLRIPEAVAERVHERLTARRSA